MSIPESSYYISKDEIKLEIDRLNSLLNKFDEFVPGLCACCGAAIPVHPITNYLIGMEDNESASIDFDILQQVIVDIALFTANKKRAEIGKLPLSCSHPGGFYYPIDRSQYEIKGPGFRQTKHEPRILRYTRLNRLGEFELIRTYADNSTGIEWEPFKDKPEKPKRKWYKFWSR